jgi:ribosomal protein S1
MDPRRGSLPQSRHHGSHTLKVWRGSVVGVFGNDVFVELGPRMQGVITLRHFAQVPRIGESFDFTLHGQEEGLWALSLKEEETLATWESMEEGSLMHARVVRLAPGGFEVKLGPLHGFMPKSQSGLAREEKADVLVGRSFTVEVIEVDPERQRVIVSRKLVAQRERESLHQREIAGLRVGERIQGRVIRLAPFGAFVAFGQGMQGLVHISDLSHERLNDPAEAVRIGEVLDLVVLSVRMGGRRIGLGRKQLIESPWKSVEQRHYIDQIVIGKVLSVQEYGLFLSIGRGIEGLLHISECGLPDGVTLRSRFRAGQELAVRIHELDASQQRLALSMTHRGGSMITREELENAQEFAELSRLQDQRHLDAPLGNLLMRALRASQGQRSMRA